MFASVILSEAAAAAESKDPYSGADISEGRDASTPVASRPSLSMTGLKNDVAIRQYCSSAIL